MIRSMTDISNEFNCDKSTYHKYTNVYPIFMEKFRNEDFSLFEIGIDEGKSYKLWESYFTTARIYGMDISKQFNTDRGIVFQGDQSNVEHLKDVSSKIENCKIIIDDGSHVAEHQLTSFYYLFQNLLQGDGIYIIEDVECSYWKPSLEIYGYQTGHLNIVDYFTKLNHSVNSHYNLHDNPLNIKMISFAPNCIIILKGNKEDQVEREYKYVNKLEVY